MVVKVLKMSELTLINCVEFYFFLYFFQDTIYEEIIFFWFTLPFQLYNRRTCYFRNQISALQSSELDQLYRMHS